jgi:hypothetical protein
MAFTLDSFDWMVILGWCVIVGVIYIVAQGEEAVKSRSSGQHGFSPVNAQNAR